VLDRHAAVDELRPRLDLREDLALLGQDVRAGLHEAALVGWSNRPPVPVTAFVRLTAFALALAFVTGISGYFLQLWSLRPLLLVILAQFAYALFIRDRIREIRAAADLPAADLRLIAALLQRFEAERFESAALHALRSRLSRDGRPASAEIERLRRLIDWHDQARNQFFALIAAPLLWKTQFSFAIELWRQRSGSHIADWLNAIGELEALSSLGGYAAEHPEDPFPELVSEGPLFDGTGVTHPLLAETAAVRNDVRLGGDVRLLLVSGSNMSGKSTLLRSVGLNAVLAWAGAPVRCRRLRISPLAVGASLRTLDSIQDGKSRFYAEISRLRQIIDMTGAETPLLYLLDELLSGTNSHDRRIGAEALIRSLAERRTIGLVTTHDLALTAVAGALGPAAVNVHFEDHLEDGRIAFDYRMRLGVVTKSNAIELMRAVGLPV
jgi:hypothetical protein